MKKTVSYILLAAGTFGLLAYSTLRVTADDAMPGMSCCGGMAATTEVSDSLTNAIPDRLATCPVSGEKLGADMGKPYTFVYKGQEVKLCCPSCKKDFEKTPEKFIGKIRAADKKS